MELQFTDKQLTAQRSLADAQFGDIKAHPVIEGIKSLIDAGMYTEALEAIEDLMVNGCGYVQYRGHFTDGTWFPVSVVSTLKYRRNWMRIPAGTVTLATMRNEFAGLQVWDPFTGNTVAQVDPATVKSL